MALDGGCQPPVVPRPPVQRRARPRRWSQPKSARRSLPCAPRARFAPGGRQSRFRHGLRRPRRWHFPAVPGASRSGATLPSAAAGAFRRVGRGPQSRPAANRSEGAAATSRSVGLRLWCRRSRPRRPAGQAQDQRSLGSGVLLAPGAVEQVFVIGFVERQLALEVRRVSPVAIASR